MERMVIKVYGIVAIDLFFLLLTRKKSEQDLPAEIHSGTLYERAPCPSKELFPDSESPV